MNEGSTLTTAIGWVVYLDVYGFAHLLTERPELLHDMDLCLAETWRRVEQDLIPPIVRTFQDSLILFYPVADEEERFIIMRRCLDALEELLVVFFHRELVFRGAIAYGEVSFNSIGLVGPAFLRAYQAEQAILAPLIVMLAIEYWDDDLNQPSYQGPIVQVVHYKDGGERFGALFHPYPRDGFVDFVHKQRTHYLLHGPSKVAEAWNEAYTYIVTHLN